MSGSFFPVVVLLLSRLMDKWDGDACEWGCGGCRGRREYWDRAWRCFDGGSYFGGVK